jgi:hypothetical protein
MPEPPLPEDLSRWPESPFELLGVRPGTPAREVRKAYSRLIRHFKPEQYPEHFRRIRDAFEAVQRFGAFFDDLPEQEPAPERIPFPDESPPDEPAFPNLELDPSPADAGPGPRVFRRPGQEDDLGSLWDRACNGEMREVYQRLRELADRLGNPQEACVRLYWLLRTAPELDPCRSPCDWLVRALRSGGWSGPCRDLYEREINRRPEEVLEERFAHLLQVEAPLPILSEWYRWRWQAAARLGEWRVITRDLTAARPRFTAGLEDANWVLLLLAALDHLAWFSEREPEMVVKKYCDELEGLTHLHARNNLDRLDILLEMSRSWKGLMAERNPLFEVVGVIPASWNGATSELRRPLQAALRKLLADPEKALAVFDGLKANAPLVFVQLSRLIQTVVEVPPYAEVEPPSSEDLQRLAASFVELLPLDMRLLRASFYHFCTCELLLPEEAATAMERVPGCPTLFLEQVRKDEPLRLACLAYRWFWS